MRLLGYVLILFLSISMIGCDETGPRNVLEGASQEKIDAYRARQAELESLDGEGDLVNREDLDSTGDVPEERE